MDYSNLRWLQWRKAIFQSVIYHCVLDGLFDSFGKNDDDVQNYKDAGELSNQTYCGVFLIDTWTPVISYSMK